MKIESTPAPNMIPAERQGQGGSEGKLVQA